MNKYPETLKALLMLLIITWAGACLSLALMGLTNSDYLYSFLAIALFIVSVVSLAVIKDILQHKRNEK